MNRISKATITAATAACLLLGTGTAAHADTVVDGENFSKVTQTTAAGYAEAEAWWSDTTRTPVYSKTSTTYVTGYFGDTNSGYTMNGWLERSTDGGASWYTVSGVHSLSGNSSAETDAYYDGPGYLARSCFQFTSWSGAAVHCSHGI
ncbi:hypothetical protein EDD99_6524 [Streptomyces sp. 846.5]|nr:hypothetical protein [Streptomyces sp. 846.5]TDT98297.1 hypothetical protein EDD99_6524 [Streptomyces sp. 846.5]